MKPDLSAYVTKGKCPFCDDILWTTDDLSPVVCRCGKTTLTPEGEDNVSQVDDREFEKAVRKDMGLDDHEEVTVKKWQRRATRKT